MKKRTKKIVLDQLLAMKTFFTKAVISYSEMNKLLDEKNYQTLQQNREK